MRKGGTMGRAHAAAAIVAVSTGSHSQAAAVSLVAVAAVPIGSRTYSCIDGALAVVVIGCRGDGAYGDDGDRFLRRGSPRVTVTRLGLGIGSKSHLRARTGTGTGRSFPCRVSEDGHVCRVR